MMIFKKSNTIHNKFYLNSLQTAVSTSSESSTFTKQQLTEKQQQILVLQKTISEKDVIAKEKNTSISSLEKEIGSLKIQILNEVFVKKDFLCSTIII